MTVAPSRKGAGRAGSIRVEAACLLAILCVPLNMLDAALASLALSPVSTEANLLAAESGFDLVLKTLISIAFVILLLVIRWWRAIALLCVACQAWPPGTRLQS